MVTTRASCKNEWLPKSDFRVSDSRLLYTRDQIHLSYIIWALHFYDDHQIDYCEKIWNGSR